MFESDSEMYREYKRISYALDAIHSDISSSKKSIEQINSDIQTQKEQNNKNGNILSELQNLHKISKSENSPSGMENFNFDDHRMDSAVENPILLSFLFFAILIPLHSFVFYAFANWFVAPFINITSISYLHSFGLMLVFGALRPSGDPKSFDSMYVFMKNTTIMTYLNSGIKEKIYQQSKYEMTRNFNGAIIGSIFVEIGLLFIGFSVHVLM